MRVIILYVLIITFLAGNVYAQCPVSDFNIPGTVCKNQSVSVTNTSTNSTTYKWDFCDGSILNTPTTSGSTLSLGSNPNCISSQVENGKVYSFVTNRGTGKLLRMDFGTQVTGTPTVVDFGNFGSLVQNPQGIDFFTQGSNHYALITSLDGSVYLLSFGNSVTNTPSAAKISGVTGLNDLRQVDIVNDDDKIYAVIAGGGASGVVTVLSFGTSILNTPTITNIPFGGAFLTGIQVVRECNQWYVLVEGYSSGLHLLNFGSSLTNTPTISNVGSINVPLNVKVVQSSGTYYAFIPTDSNEDLLRLNFGSSVNNLNPTVTDLGNFSTLSLPIAFDVIALGSKYYAVSVNFTDNKITTFDFPKNCNITSDFSGVSNPAPAYTSSGTFDVTLHAYDSKGNVSSKTKTVTISSSSAPDIDFTNTPACATQTENFTSVNSSGNLSGYNWDFGDGNTSAAANPTNTFNTAGGYNVSLSVNASNGCSNSIKKTISIFNLPQADFVLPSANPICTNQEYTFTNSSTVDAGTNPVWEWSVNGSVTSSSQDLKYTIASPASQQIKLKVTIPGCSQEVTKDLNNVQSGPVLDFTFSNGCEDASIQFTNTSVGATAHDWDFKDGNTSSASDPANIFSNPGTYDVTLSGGNAGGCLNTLTKTVTVYSKPQPNFSLALPPFSCSGSDSQFSDATPNPTDSNLQGWQWDFGDASSGQNSATQKNPQHLYANAGNYNVSLTVTTDFNCSAQVQKNVTIAQSPDATVTNTPTCKDQTVQFNAAKTGIQSWYWQIGNTFYFIDNPTYVFTSVGNHDVFLTITGNNGCVSSTTKTINVPAQLFPDFTTDKNCVGQNTKFIDETPTSDDPVIDEEWDFSDGSTGSGSPAFHAFANTGDYDITMVVQSQAGCFYSFVKKITVVSSPTASFTASPETGVPPLEVQFTNKSTNASTYVWAFNDADNSMTTSVSPTFTFQDYGDFVIDLTATNSQGCSDTFSKIIRAALPVNDIALTALNVTDAGDGSWKCIATLRNEGNLNVDGVQLLLSISGGPAVQEKITNTILPGATLNHELGFEILKAVNLDYICAEVVIQNDSNESNDKLCSQIGDALFIFTSYPNPASDKLNVEWISPDEASTITISLVDTIGKQVISSDLASTKGLNKFLMDTSGLRMGLYVLTVESKGRKKTQRIVVNR